MASLGQKRGGCGHLMAAFDTYTHYARCRDKGKGSDPCVLKLDCTCTNCNELTTDQRAQLATPSYQIKKEKHDSKSDKSDRNEAEDTSFALVNQALVSVVGLVNDQKKSKSPEKSLAKDKGKKKQSTPSKPAKPSADSKIETLDQK